MEILKIVAVILVSLAVILPGYLKNKVGRDQKLISAIAGVLMLVLVWLFPPDPKGSLYARIGLTVMGIVPIVFWLKDLRFNSKKKV